MTALAMRNLEGLLPKVRRDVDNCPDPIMLDELAEAAREFCRETTAWRNECGVIAVEEGKHTYIMRHPDALPHRIHEANYEAPGQTAPVFRTPLYPFNEHKARGGQQGGASYHRTFHPVGQFQDWKLRTGQPRWYIHDITPQQVRVVPIPTAIELSGSLYFTVSLIPKMDARVLPEWIIDRYYETLVSGAKARLLGMASKQWTDPGKSAVEEEKFDAAVQIAKADIINSFTIMSQTVEPRFPLA